MGLVFSLINFNCNFQSISIRSLYPNPFLMLMKIAQVFCVCFGFSVNIFDGFERRGLIEIDWTMQSSSCSNWGYREQIQTLPTLQEPIVKFIFYYFQKQTHKTHMTIFSYQIRTSVKLEWSMVVKFSFKNVHISFTWSLSV